MASDDIPRIQPTEREIEFFAWQAYLRQKICRIFEISEEELNSAYDTPNYNETNLGRTLHGAGASDSETE